MRILPTLFLSPESPKQVAGGCIPRVRQSERSVGDWYFPKFVEDSSYAFPRGHE